MSVDWNASILFVNNKYWKSIHKDLFKFKIYVNFNNFFSDFLCQNMLIPLSPKISQGAKRAKLYTTISRRTTFSPNPHLVEEATCFTFFTPWYSSNWTTQSYVSARTQMLSPTQMGLLLINCYYHEFGNTES